MYSDDDEGEIFTTVEPESKWRWYFKEHEFVSNRENNMSNLKE